MVFQLDLYYALASPPSRAIMILSKLLKIDLNLKNVKLLSGEHRDDEFVKINPRKVVPVLNDNGYIVAESRVIMSYLINKYKPGNKLYPSDPKERAQVDRMLYLTAESFQRGRAIITHVMGSKEVGGVPEHLTASYIELLSVIDTMIEDKKYLTGNTMTIADISLICDLGFFTDVFLVDITTLTNVVKWRETVRKTLEEDLSVSIVKELLDDAVADYARSIHVKLGALAICPQKPF